MPAKTEQLAEIAEFNQIYGAVLRDLHRSSLQLTATNGTSRVLLALGRRERASSRQLCEDLGMDPAQLSRLVLRLTDEGHIVSLPNSGDRRVGTLVLTREGDAAFAALEGEQIEALAAMVAHLSDSEIEQLLDAMALVQNLLDRD